MTMLTPSEQSRQAAEGKAVRKAYRSPEELAIRDKLEEWCRARWPDARIVHELVMGRGAVRADLAAITPNHIVVFEIKGPYDDTSRLLHQIGMYRLATPEVWIVTASEHDDDGRLIRHLLPSVGHLRVGGISVASMYRVEPERMSLAVAAEAASFEVLPDALLSLLWVSELAAEAARARVMTIRSSKPPSHAALVKAMLKLTPAEQLAAVCRQLRARNAFWRADPPIVEAQVSGAAA
jgi:hypothetical protein